MADTQEGAAGLIVVGVDGSEHAEHALRYAFAEAARRVAKVRAVTAFEPPEAWAFAWGLPGLPDSGEARREVEEKAREWVEGVRASLPERLQAVPCDVEAKTGPAAVVLVDAARNADVLVVGHRGRGALQRAMLGSVGLGCVVHADCPVIIVPPPRAFADSPVAGAPNDRA